MGIFGSHEFGGKRYPEDVGLKYSKAGELH